MQQHLTSLLTYVSDKWLTWRTGYTRAEREYIKWNDETVVHRAHTIENRFMSFKHIIEVDYAKWFDLAEPFGYVPCHRAKSYMWPTRQLGNNAVYYHARGYRDRWDNKFHFEDMFGGDSLFVATNNDRDAIMIALTFSK